MATQSAEFQTAVEDSRKLEKKPTDNELLEIYGLYKQATQDPPFAEANVPSSWDFKGKYKYKAWEKVMGLTPEQAQEQYVALIEKMKGTHGYKA